MGKCTQSATAITPLDFTAGLKQLLYMYMDMKLHYYNKCLTFSATQYYRYLTFLRLFPSTLATELQPVVTWS